MAYLDTENYEAKIEEFNRLKTDAKLSGSQMDAISYNIRRWKGRDSIESNLKPELRLNTKSLKDYFTTVRDYMDSSLKDDKMHATEMRLDYALVSQSFLQEYNALVTAAAIKTEETNNLSDHYPLEIIFSKY